MLIKQKRSIIPACDVRNLLELHGLVSDTKDFKTIGGYKIGISLVLEYGLIKVAKTIRALTNKPIIYDHQKAGNDIPDMGNKFAKACRSAKINAVILFPFAGIETQIAWIKACQKEKLHIIVGGEMTHGGFFSYIKEDAPSTILKTAASLGIKDFVLPGNKPDKIKEYREFLENKNEDRITETVYYSPGLISQGGDITNAGKAAGKNWHAIVGRTIYQSNSIKETIEILSKQL